MNDSFQEGKDDEDPNRIPSSPDFHTIHVFTQPAKANGTFSTHLESLDLLCFLLLVELIAGKLTRLLVGARNNGSENFVVESIDGSLRYPQDYTYYIQNFTALRSEKLVEPGFESTFEYLFMPSETFNGRPMGLVILMNYRNNVKPREMEFCLLDDFRGLFRKEDDFKMWFTIKQSISSMLKKDSTVKRKSIGFIFYTIEDLFN